MQVPTRMTDEPITPQRMDELLQYLPLFETPGRPFVQFPSGRREAPEEVSTVPYPEYCEEMLAFFWLAGQPCWSDLDYDPRQAQVQLSDDSFIRSCSLAELKTLLTYCVRSERFADGAWLHLLESGRIVVLLKRLAVLRESL